MDILIIYSEHNSIMKIFLVVLAIILPSIICDPTPPTLSGSFQVRIDETYNSGGVSAKTNGFWFYDGAKNRERIDRVNGRYNAFCGTVLPNVTTSCTSLAVNGLRYIIFPQRSQCCICCDSAHGCGPLTRDWLKDAKYLGQETIVDTVFDKWNQDGVVGYNYWWATADKNQTPRRLDENGAHITDYLMSSYINKTIPDSVFNVPSYCKDPCPSTSICGKFRDQIIEDQE